MNKKAQYTQLNRQFAGNLDSRYEFDSDAALEEYLNKEETAYPGMMVYLKDSGTLLMLNNIGPITKPPVAENETPEGDASETNPDDATPEDEEAAIVTEEGTENEIIYYAHEIVTGDQFNKFLATSIPYVQLCENVNTFHQSTQDAINIVNDDTQAIVNQLNELHLKFNALVDYIKSKYPDDEIWKDADIPDDMPLTPDEEGAFTPDDVTPEQPDESFDEGMNGPDAEEDEEPEFVENPTQEPAETPDDEPEEVATPIETETGNAFENTEGDE